MGSIKRSYTREFKKVEKKSTTLEFFEKINFKPPKKRPKSGNFGLKTLIFRKKSVNYFEN